MKNSKINDQQLEIILNSIADGVTIEAGAKGNAIIAD